MRDLMDMRKVLLELIEKTVGPYWMSWVKRRKTTTRIQRKSVLCCKNCYCFSIITTKNEITSIPCVLCSVCAGEKNHVLNFLNFFEVVVFSSWELRKSAEDAHCFCTSIYLLFSSTPSTHPKCNSKLPFPASNSLFTPSISLHLRRCLLLTLPSHLNLSNLPQSNTKIIKMTEINSDSVSSVTAAPLLPALPKMNPHSPEIMDNQATINIGTLGHVGHGKTTLVEAITGTLPSCKSRFSLLMQAFVRFVTTMRKNAILPFALAMLTLSSFVAKTALNQIASGTGQVFVATCLVSLFLLGASTLTPHTCAPLQRLLHSTHLLLFLFRLFFRIGASRANSKEATALCVAPLCT